MQILIASPLRRAITSKVTAARPRIVFDLVSGLIKRGHKVSVLGTKDSLIPGAQIIPVIPRGFVNMKAYENPFYIENSFLVKEAAMITKIGNNFDIVHNHAYPEFVNLLTLKNLKVPVATTFHLQITNELDEIISQFNEEKNSYLIALSKAHQKAAKKSRFYTFIYHGVDTNLYKYNEKKENYLLWIGRLSKAKDKKGNFIDPKGVKWAIKLAKETDSNIILSGNVEDKDFFDKEIKPYLSRKIRWVGKVSTEQPLTKKEVSSLMQKAKAFLFTSNFPEPFGLVITEAQSCGTPVIAFNRGAVGELVVNEKTGFTINPKEKINGLKKALSKISEINPRDCREHIEKKFSLEKMIDNYENLYKQICLSGKPKINSTRS